MPKADEKGARVELVRLSYKPLGAEEPLFSSINLSLAPSARVAVVGPSGAGKSTLVDLIYGLRMPSSGRIDVDAIDMRDVDLGLLREQIALVREPEIFDGTVRENVQVGRPDVTITDVREALTAVGLYEDIAALSEGLETPLPTGGAPLSRGQTLRLCIARALAGKPRLVLFDAPLSDLDPVSKKAILEALFERKGRWTVLLTTHDKEALRYADEIHVVDGGKLRALRAGDLG